MRKPDDIQPPSRMNHLETDRGRLMKESQRLKVLELSQGREQKITKENALLDLVDNMIIEQSKLPQTTWYVVTVKLKGKAKSEEEAKENCKSRLIQTFPEKCVEIVDASKCSSP